MCVFWGLKYLYVTKMSDEDCNGGGNSEDVPKMTRLKRLLTQP